MDYEWDLDGRQLPTENKDTNRDYDHRELRRRLSLDTDFEEPDRLMADRTRQSDLRAKLTQKMNLQICFVDDDDVGDENGHPDHDADMNSAPNSLQCPPESNGKHSNGDTIKSKEANGRFLPQLNLSSLLHLKLRGNGTSSAPNSKESFSSFSEYHSHLHFEAKKALKAAKTMAKMQVQLEQEQNESIKSKEKKTFDQLKNCSRKHLKALAMKLESQTNLLNSQLVQMLEQRDDLLVEQNSLLVDIEDLTRFMLAKDLEK